MKSNQWSLKLLLFLSGLLALTTGCTKAGFSANSFQESLSVDSASDKLRRRNTTTTTTTLPTTTTVPASTPTTLPPTSVSSSRILCGSEGAFCSFSGTRQVRYGIDSQYFTQTFSDGVNCSNDVFGDPVFGTAKQCWYEDTLTTAMATTTTLPALTTTTLPAPASAGGCGTGIPTDACVDARALMQVTSTITATTNQVIENLHISTSSGPCINIPNGVTGVIIRDNDIGPCGNMTNLADVGVDIQGANNPNITVTRNRIRRVAGFIRVWTSQNGFTFTKNLMYNAQGPRWSGNGIHLLHVTGGSAKTLIQCNVIDDATEQPYMEQDHMNFGSSSGASMDLNNPAGSAPIEVSYNRIRGNPLGPVWDADGSTQSGSGIQIADCMNGPCGASNFWVHHNIVSKINGSGLGHWGGISNAIFEDNRVDNRGATLNSWTGWSFEVNNGNGDVCNNLVWRRNRGIAYLWAWNHDGSLQGNPGWPAGCSGGFSSGADANNFQDATLDGNAMFSEPQPAICQ